MLRPAEMKLSLPMSVANGRIATTTDVWEILEASREGNQGKVEQLLSKCQDLVYAQYNYTPPIHFAAREGHIDLVKYLLTNGAYDPAYRIYPFQESLESIASGRGQTEIVHLLEEYAADSSRQKYRGDNGEIHYKRTDKEKEFEKAVDKEDISHVRQLLNEDPSLVNDNTYFWGEGIMMMPAKAGNYELVELLLSYGATFPTVTKWAQFYYFETYGMAVFLMEKGMDPNTLSWQHVSLLHDMAQKGNLDKAALLVKYGADINAVDEEYCSTPLGMASKWGQLDMVEYLLDQGADPRKAGASWASPLEWAKKNGYDRITELLLRKLSA